MSLHQTLEATVTQEVRQGKFNGKVSLSQAQQSPAFSAHITLPTFREIALSYDERYEDSHRGKTAIVLADATAHEINHKRYNGFVGCPQNVDYHVERFIEPMTAELPSYSQNTIHDLANALQDTILHADLHKKRSLNGITDFFYEVGNSAEKKTFSPFYQAHVMLNMYMWGSKKQKSQLSEFYKQSSKKQKEIAGAVKQFLKESGIATADAQGEKDFTALRSYVVNEDNWETISRAYAKAMQKLVSPSQSSSLFDNLAKNAQGEKQPTPKESSGRNQFDEEMQTPAYKARRMQRAFDKDEQVPNWLDKFDALDTLYTSLAKRLDLRVESFTQSAQFPVAWYRQRDFDPTADKPKHLTVGIRTDGTVGLKRKTHSDSVSVPVKTSPKGVPAVRYCMIDCSGSMQSAIDDSDKIGRTNCIPWGDNSKYHYALLGWYGLLSYLDQHHISGETQVNLGSFSSKTELVEGLDASKRLALNPRFGNSTKIDAKALDSLFTGNGNLIFTISDGQVENWSAIKEKVCTRAKQHYYVHIQIGNETQMTNDLQENGLKSVIVKSGKDLTQVVIDITNSTFNRGVK